ncbi:MAG: deoxyribonuclease V [bacterium]
MGKMMRNLLMKQPADISEARSVQKILLQKIILKDGFRDSTEVKRVAGCDVAYSRIEQELLAVVVVVELDSFVILEKATFKDKAGFPYIPGFLSFREGPALLGAIKGLRTQPDVFLFDGHGIAHPRRMGIASHLGVILDRPAIGCAKSLLYGSYDEPAKEKGSYSFIKDEKGKSIGLVLRTKDAVKPVFVSPGHRVGLKTAGEIVLRCTGGCRIPEPLRLAHIAANAILRSRSDMLATSNRFY